MLASAEMEGIRVCTASMKLLGAAGTRETSAMDGKKQFWAGGAM
jgi:hypothetical protein